MKIMLTIGQSHLNQKFSLKYNLYKYINEKSMRLK